MPHFVTFLVNLVDSTTIDNNVLLPEIINVFARHNISATFMVSEGWIRRVVHKQRHSMIDNLQTQEIGFFSDTCLPYQHSSSPPAKLNWDDQTLTMYDRAVTATETLRDVFGQPPTCWGQTSDSWCPQVNAALHRLNLPAIVYPKTCTQAGTGPHWYAGVLVFPNEAIFHLGASLFPAGDVAHTLSAVQEMLQNQRMVGARWMGISMTPARYAANAAEAVAQNLDHLLEGVLRNNQVRYLTIGQARQLYSSPSQTVYLSEIDQAVRQSGGEEDIPTNFEHFSAAELLDMMVRIYSDFDPDRETIQRRMVFGPTEEPTPFDPIDEPIYWPDFMAACRMVANYVTYQHRLPANVFLRHAEWNIGAFFRGAIDMWPKFRNGRPPHFVEWQPAYMYPAIGHNLAVAVQDSFESAPACNVTFDLNDLLMHTCFQSWTLRPAVAGL